MDPSPAAITDRRTLIKEQHRAAIIDAAAVLMDEIGSTEFTVDRLAERAHVSRRTIFNHFTAVDDIVLAVVGQTISDILDRFRQGLEAIPARDAEPDSRFAAVTTTLRAIELVGPMAYLTRVLGGGEDAPSRGGLLFARAFDQFGSGLLATIRTRYPETDELTVELFTYALTSGLIVIHRHWAESTGATVDASSRQVWTGLLDRVLETTRTGFATM